MLALKYFRSSIIFTIAAILVAGIVGFFYGAIWSFIFTTITLGALEISVSFDNAVVNVRYLKKMNDESRHWFLTWGMVIAVFGMRLVLPILIVCLAAWINPYEAVIMAFTNPEKYKSILDSVHVLIMGFGAGFLLMITLKFFFDSEKDNHWIPGLEKFASFVGRFPQVEVLIAIPIILTVGYFAPHEGQALQLSSFGGLLMFYFINGLKEKLEENEENNLGKMILVQTTGIMIWSVLFIEILDASFSFDGVIAAFAISSNIIIIAAGLGIGAMFVRSLTIYFVNEEIVDGLMYLENGAFVGILWLVCAMYSSAYGHPLPEIVVAGGAVLSIGASAIHSLIIKKDEEKEEALV